MEDREAFPQSWDITGKPRSYMYSFEKAYLNSQSLFIVQRIHLRLKYINKLVLKCLKIIANFTIRSQSPKYSNTKELIMIDDQMESV